MPALGGDEAVDSGALTTTAPPAVATSTDATQRHLEKLDEAVLTARAGDVRAALDLLTPMARLRRRGLPPLGRARLVAALIDCRLQRGDLAEAMTLGDDLSPFLTRARVSTAPAAAAVAHHAKGGLAAAFGDPGSAQDHYESVGVALAAAEAAGGPLDSDATEDVRGWRNGAALAMLRSGLAREANALAREEVDRVAESGGPPYAQATALRVLAATDTGLERIPLVRLALAAAPGAESTRLTAQISTDLAGLLVLGSDPAARTEAVGLLRMAEEYASHQGLWPLHSRVRRLLDRLGETPRRFGDEAMAVLSEVERTIATLAAEGLSNRVIAERLAFGMKAVEWHLSRIYRKLGVSGRRTLGPTLGLAPTPKVVPVAHAAPVEAAAQFPLIEPAAELPLVGSVALTSLVETVSQLPPAEPVAQTPLVEPDRVAPQVELVTQLPPVEPVA